MKRLVCILALVVCAAAAAAQTPQYLPRTGGSVGGSVYLGDGAAPCSPKNKAFGAKFDGVTDDTAADQAFLNYVNTHSCAVQLPAGTSLISASLTVPFTQFVRFWGMCRYCTTFKMATDNTPVFVFSSPDTHSLDFGYFSVTWANQQGTGNTNAIAFKFTTSSTDANGFYSNHFHDLGIDRSNRTFAVISAAGQETFWGNTIENNRATNVTGSFFWAAPFTVIGMPVNRINGNLIFGYSPASVNTEGGPAIFEIAGEYEIDGNLIQNWNQEVVWGQGGGHVSFRDNHIENQSLASSSGRVFYFANGSWVAENNSIAMIPGQAGLSGAQVFGTSGSYVTWNSNRLDAPAAGSIGTWYLTNNSGSVIQGGNNADTFTSLTPMLSASLAEWVPGSQYAPAFQLLQSTPQPIHEGTNGASTAAYLFAAGPDASTAGLTLLRNTGAANTWTVGQFYFDGNKFLNFRYCANNTSIVPTCTSPVPSFQVQSTTGHVGVLNFNGLTGDHTYTLPNADATLAPLNGAALTPASVVIGGGANLVLRCTVAGTLPVGALTSTAGNCGASVSTSLTVN